MGMFESEKTIEIKGRHFAFRFPTMFEETEIQTEVLRRLSGVTSFTPGYDRVFTQHYLNVAMERFITKAPDNWYEEEELLGQKAKVLRVAKFFGDEPEFMEVRNQLADFLNSFPRSEQNAKGVSKGNGSEGVESAPSVPPIAPVPKPAGDFGRGSGGD